MNQYQSPQQMGYSSGIGPATVQIRPMELLNQAKQLMGDQYMAFVGITFVGMLVAGLVPMGILMGPMICGIYLCFMERHSGRPTEFGTLFKGFDYFADSFLAYLIFLGISIAVIIPLYVLFFVGMIIAGAVFGDAAGIMIMLFTFIYIIVVMFVSIALYLPFLFVFQLIVGHGLKPWEAVKTSFAGAKANMGGLVLLLVVFSLISGLAAMACYIPVFFVLPLQFGALYILYKQIFPVANKQPMY